MESKGRIIRNYTFHDSQETIITNKPKGTAGGGRTYKTESEISVTFWIYGFDKKTKENYIKQFTKDIRVAILQRIGKKRAIERIRAAIEAAKPETLVIEIDHQRRTCEISSATLDEWAEKVSEILANYNL